MYTISVTETETILLDWILTMHSWDPGLLDQLTGKYGSLRASIGLALVGVTDEVRIDQQIMDEILAMVPVMFRIGGEDTGMSLKKKLWRAVLHLAETPPATVEAPSAVQEVFDAYEG